MPKAVTVTIFSIMTALSGCISTPQPPAVQPCDTLRRATLVFIGDLMQHTPQIEAARTDSGFDYEECFRYIRPTLDSADAVIVNLETTLSYSGKYTGYPMFRSPAQLARGMRESGIDIAVLANNHICDNAGTGIEHTVSALDSAEIASTGAFTDSARCAAFNPLVFEAGSIRFALLNYTYSTNGLPVARGRIVNLIDTAYIKRDIAKARRCGAECIIAYYHWGEEYSPRPSAAQRRLAAWSARQGIDIVIGSHPHVLQPIEYLRGPDSAACGAVYYSLGNFVSNQRKRRCDGGMIARIGVIKTGKNSPSYDFAYSLVWVHAPFRDGRRIYTVLPSWVADTMLEDGSAAKASYELFMKDSGRLLHEL